MRRRSSLLQALRIGLPSLACALLVGSLAWFLAAAEAGRARLGEALPSRADGIVVLTGGAERLATALRLLAAGRARILLVSGVGGEAGFAALARQAGADPALASRVTLGRAALSTRGNALETAGWVRTNHLASLIVVTAYYHMPRALAELSRALPGVRLKPVAAQPPLPEGAAGLRLLAEEYAKWVMAEVRLSGLGLQDSLPSQIGPAGSEGGTQMGGDDHRTRAGG